VKLALRRSAPVKSAPSRSWLLWSMDDNIIETARYRLMCADLIWAGCVTLLPHPRLVRGCRRMYYRGRIGSVRETTALTCDLRREWR
jgi:hypothetical protein